ncbi:Gfo/Idh/MocA family protein [Jiulongibacter sediminis]|uniref:Oxidoreductase n=1 Tax=Jiulongibacter sediminis TaxID=1605367 RepID=A0A0N8H982_9BACT|nr:Gfo/Idh/MocA family oxidoreductase [Jiulongibacter sediminis]KPM46644.1 oxidoreductase [Jiulongibacter sediminis]TBX21501.1 oxidoreductase [Jiulongibacter sediminis]
MLIETNRRTFIKKAGLSMAGFYYFPHLMRKPAPSDTVRVALIGINGMGLNHLRWFAGITEVEIAALCDVDENHLKKAAETLKEIRPDAKPKLFTDFRRILDDPEIDAISCATPDHWHAQVAIMAFQASKDVYGEKPLSYTLREGELMFEAMKANNRIFQLGTQIHAGDNYHRVAELIQAGVIGKVHNVKLWKTGSPPVFEKATYQDVPKELNWDFWQGPAPERRYHPERCHVSYRYFLDYSGGIFQDFWCHIADIVWWSINPQKLESISATGSKSAGIGDTPDSINIEYKFKKLDLSWSSEIPDVPGAGTKHIGAFFTGDKGTMLADYSSREIRIDGEVLKDIEDIPKTILRSPGHQQNFIDCVKTRQQPESNLAYAKEMTKPMHLGLISWKLGRPLAWNYKKNEFKGDIEANNLLFRPYRDGYNWIGA